MIEKLKTFLLDNKGKLIALVIVLAITLYFFPSSKSKTTITTETKSNEVSKWETKTVTTIKGTGKDRVETVSRDTVGTDNKTSDTKTQTIIVNALSRYSVEMIMPLSIVPGSTFLLPDYSQTQVLVGRRILDFPVFVELGTNGHFNQVLVGLRFEF